MQPESTISKSITIDPRTESAAAYIGQGYKIILFDGVCKLCNGWSQFVIRHDPEAHFKLATVQSPEGQAILQHFAMPTDSFDTMLYIDDDKPYEKSDAFLQVIAHFGLPWRCLALLRWLPKGFRDWCYDRIALNRYKLFGRYQHCIVPNSGLRRHFLVDD